MIICSTTSGGISSYNKLAHNATMINLFYFIVVVIIIRSKCLSKVFCKDIRFFLIAFCLRSISGVVLLVEGADPLDIFLF